VSGFCGRPSLCSLSCEEFYKDLNERYPKDSETCSKLPFVDCETGLRPDWYFKPNEVWEMRGADITLSPVYPAAKGKIPGVDRGLSMRFPRFMKLRDDKGTAQATTPVELAEAYFRQEAGRQEDIKKPADAMAATKPPAKIRHSVDSDFEEEDEVEEEDAWAADIL
jgi:DNA ligase-1